MAVSLATGADYLKRTTGLVDMKTGPATVMMWVKFEAPGAGSRTFWVQIDSPGTYQDWISISQSAATPNVYEDQAVGGAITTTTLTPRVADTWFHVCIIRISVSATIWMVNGLVIGINNRNMTLATLAEEYLGNDTFSDGGLTIAYAREWDAILTTTEVLVEMQSTTPVKTANLWANWSFDANINDDSGNGRNWTQFGASTFVAPPTFPVNSSIGTAIALAGNDTVLPDFEDGFTTWYSYTPTLSTEDVLSVFARSSLTDTIEIETFGAGVTAYPGSGSIVADNKPIQVPLLDGTTVYFRLFISDNLTATASLTTRMGPTTAAPIGTLLINDDTGGFPLAMLSPTTGAPLQFMNPFPEGEMVAVLNNGNVLLEDKTNSQLRLLDPSLNTLGSVAFPWGAGLVGALNSDRVQTFYASKFGASVAYQLDSAGTVLDSFTVASSIFVMCPNRDNTILYYVTAGTNQAIKRWDLVNDVALSNLAAGVVNHFAIKNLLVLSDDTVLVAYGKSTATTDYFVRHYSAAGATLGDYTLSDTTEKINWLQLVDDTLFTVVIWSFPTIDVTSRFTFIDASVLTLISETPVVPIYEVGVYQPSASLTPDAYFGHSKSCPIWALAASITPTPSVNETEFLIRRERVFPHLSQEQMRMFFSLLQIDLQAGNGLTTGQGENPILELDWSDDGGWTWSNVHLIETGRKGEFTRRAIQRRLGSSRDRVFRIAVSDPVQWAIINGYMQVVLGNS